MELKINPMKWQKDHVLMLEQTLLPEQHIYIKIETYEQMADAIKRLAIRGAPAIGIAAAYGLYLGIKDFSGSDSKAYISLLKEVKDYIASQRPTAYNLFWALDICEKEALSHLEKSGIEKSRQSVLDMALSLHEDDRNRCEMMGKYGAELIEDGFTGITYCNAGILATGGMGTATAPYYTAKTQGKNIKVIACETRPLLQGARLTSWELMQNNVDVTLICDNMIGFLFQRQKVDIAIVGADRVAMNGDIANKIGTYNLACLCHKHNIPFYCAAPLSTFDPNLDMGSKIPIEERDPVEITNGFGKQTAPSGVNVWSPAFDITPNELIHGLITEKGILRKPFDKAIREFF